MFWCWTNRLLVLMSFCLLCRVSRKYKYKWKFLSGILTFMQASGYMYINCCHCLKATWQCFTGALRQASAHPHLSVRRKEEREGWDIVIKRPLGTEYKLVQRHITNYIRKAQDKHITAPITLHKHTYMYYMMYGSHGRSLDFFIPTKSREVLVWFSNDHTVRALISYSQVLAWS